MCRDCDAEAEAVVEAMARGEGPRFRVQACPQLQTSNKGAAVQ